MPSGSANRKGNYLSNHGDRSIPRNSVALMRSIEIVVGGYVIGYVQTMTPSEGRGLWDCREIGNEDIVEIVPGGPKDQTIAIERCMLYQARMQHVFDDIVQGNGHDNEKLGRRSLMDFNYPFDIIVLQRRNTGSENSYPNLQSDSSVAITRNESPEVSTNEEIIILDHFHECWWQDIKYDVKVGDEFQVIENGTVRYTWRTGDVTYDALAEGRGKQGTFTAFGVEALTGEVA